MTRINVGVSPKELSDKMLLAEHREIKRIPNMIKSGKANLTNIPQDFTLGAGHVKFFYDKLGYLHRRYVLIFCECIRRGFNIQSYLSAWADTPKELWGNYQPTERDRQMILERIASKSHANL